MNGELGVLYQGGKQVGGFFDWEIDLTLVPTMRNGWYSFKAFKRITIQSYWLINAPDGSCYEAKLYKAIRGQLILMDSGRVEVNLPNRTLDRRLCIPLEIRWIGK